MFLDNDGYLSSKVENGSWNRAKAWLNGNLVLGVFSFFLLAAGVLGGEWGWQRKTKKRGSIRITLLPSPGRDNNFNHEGDDI